MEHTHAKLAARVISAMLHFEAFDPIAGKEVAQDHNSLRFTVAIAFVGERDPNVIVDVFGEFAGITRAQGGDHIFEAISSLQCHGGSIERKGVGYFERSHYHKEYSYNDKIGNFSHRYWKSPLMERKVCHRRLLIREI